MLIDLPELPLVRIEVPRFGIVKRHDDGAIDYVSPLPCPFNYGCVPGVLAPDGDPLDVVVMGPRLAEGATVRVRARAVMGFIDAGDEDPKLICSYEPLSEFDRRQVEWFFRIYARCKGALNRLRGRLGATRCTGWQAWPG